MTRTYAVPDLHGRCDILNAAIDRIVEHSRGTIAKVITLGDYIDRGPESRQVMERLVNWPLESLPLVALKGNHEAMMWECCKNLSDPKWWLKNGGDQTLLSYGQCATAALQISAVPAAHLDWIAKIPSVYVDEHRIFVHAGVDDSLPLDRQGDQILLWKRYPEGFRKGLGRRHVVHGHDARPDGPVLTKGRTNLDTLAWRTNRLVIGVFDDDVPGGPAELLEIKS
jgi:diadenosine tetraphosphatase ApaH/serine/threonine PP2A family protein phosphatase